ncbi:filamentous hemagglutinin N-terminal domain-containing protein, partial [Hydrocoleum sp. CS-953]|uniref:two-partner secretion domain-containing protein n=1 Tax=Hydrocoleum sp. CS-953 TaxID=1671698 RepID=UPI00117B06D6
MKANKLESYSITALTLILGILAPTPVNSQPITPANDGTGTTVTPQGNQFNIEGGTRSGANLFHSFDQFNVNSGQTANFLTTPDTRNILGRVTGGNASYINGLLQVIGGNSNLFLMNPAGIMFGPNASLNIPASFSVTTATGIGFDSNNFWFKAMGTNDYANLVGDPSGYKFNVSNPGAIVNEGNLTLNPGENLTLLGGTVINTGQLSTAGGNITIAAVEGGSVLRISQPGHLLSLEVNPVIVNGEEIDIAPLSLPGLLTGGEIIQATSVTVNENGDVVLTDSNTVVADLPGTAITSGGIDVSSAEDVGGEVNVLGDRVALIDTNINANGLNGGGTVLIGGDSQESSTVFNSQETSVNSGSIISANAIENGDGGRVIIWSDGTTNFAGDISAKGGEFSGNGGFVEVTGKEEFTFDGSVDVTAALGEEGTIFSQPESVTIGESENSNNSQIAQDENADLTISAENIEQLSGNVILEADNDITVNEKIETDSSVEFKAGRSININADIDTSVGNGNIDILGNNDEMNLANRSDGKASINQLDGTTLNAGSGTINIELGNLGEVGDINLSNLTTTGQVLVNANGGNIARVSDSSIINAGSALFQTSGSGGIGLNDAPLQLNVENLEAVSGSGGVFFDVVNVNIGGVSEGVNGISVVGGELEIKSAGDVTLTENISADGAINIEATGDISATGSGISSNGESVSLSATNIRINDEFDETSGDADVKLEATNDITVEDIEDDVLEFQPGDGEIEFRADADGDGIGVVQMLDNEADVGSDPNTFENGADTIKTNGRNLNIAGAEIILGNIDTSWLPVLSGGELLATIDVDEGGAIPAEGTEGNATFTFTVDGDLETIENLDVRFSAKHTYDGDLEVYLESPQGSAVTLFAGVGGSGQNFQDTVFDDDASTNINSGNAPFDGTYSPQGNLAGFNGENPNGTWTLRVTDNYSGDSGTLYKAGDAAPWGTATGTQLLLRNPLVQSGGGNGGAINLEATHGDISVGNIRSLSETTDGGRIDLKANNNIMTGLINSSAVQGIGGDIKIEAGGDIIATGGGIKGGGESVSLSATNITINDEFDETSGDADIKLEATNNITVEDIEDDVLEFLPGDGAIEFRADADGDGIGVVEMLDNEVDFGNNPDTFNNGADTIKTNGRNLTIAGAEIILGNVDTSWLPVFSGGELLATIDVDEGGAIPASGTEGTATFTFTVDGDLGTIENLDVRFSAAHTWDRQLEVYLESPQEQEVTLFAGVGDHLDNFQDTILDDDASTSINSGNAPFKGTYSPQGNLADFNGEDPNGRWTLTVIDTFIGNDGTLYRAGDAAPWGSAIGTQLLLRTPVIQSGGGRGNGNGGAINLEATHGDISVANIRSLSETADGGKIDLKANNNIMTGLINSSAVQGIGGNVNLNAVAGNINTESLDSSSRHGNGGNITLSTQTGNINTESLNSSSYDSNGGNITVSTETAGNINTESLNSSSQSQSGNNGGNITVSTQTGNINTKSLNSSSAYYGGGYGGNITVSSQDGDITTESLDSKSFNGNGGEITISTQTGNINTGSLEPSSYNSNGGEVTISTQDGDINTGWISSTSSSDGNGGNITVSTQTGDINTGRLASVSGGNGGNITVSTQTGDINTGTLDSYSFDGNGGEITISAQSGDINVEHLDSSSSDGNGGEITISTQSGDINAESVNSFSASLYGNSQYGGTITLNADTINFNPPEDGDTQKLAIRTFSVGTNTSGKGGDVNITTNNLTNAEIFTLSSHGKSGEVTIEIKQQENLELSDLSIITSTQVEIRIHQFQTIEREVGDKGQSGNVFINSPGNINLNNVTIESDTKGDQRAGEVSIESQGGTITFDNSSILSITNAEGDAGEITLKTPQDIQLTNNSRLQADTQGKGNAGNINIEAGTLNLDQNTSLTTETSAEGAPGQIEIKANTIDIGENAQISATVTATSTNTEEEGGKIDIFANTLNISGTLGIFAETAGLADAGTLTIQTYNGSPNLDINFSNQGFISASTSSTGKGGNISISAPETINITGNPETTDIIDGEIKVTTNNIGNAGEIKIETQNLTIAHGISISASTTGKGNAGAIKIDTNSFNLETGTSITTETNSPGAAGNIEINSPEVNIGENAQISATARENATNTETGGNISIFSNTLNISGKLGIFAETQGNSPAGALALQPYSDHPDIDINFRNSGFISARTTSTGKGGNINITAPETIDITGDGKISVETTGAGDAGNINIATQNLTIADGIDITASTTATGDAGNIDIEANNINIQNNSEILAFTEGEGKGGNITIEATETFNLDNNTQLSVETSSAGKAGDIDIKSPQVTIGEGAKISATAREGATYTKAGGNISIFSNTLNISGELGIFAETQGNSPAGALALQPYNGSPDLDINFSNQGFISARTTSIGNGGNISLFAPETIDITGDGKISVETTATGNAGQIEILTPNLTITDSIDITATTTSSGTGGNISLNVEEAINITGDGKISVETTGTGNAGRIEIETGDLTIADGMDITASTTNTGNAGNIKIEASNIDIQNGSQVLAFTEGDGKGGNITIEATETFKLDNNTQLSVETNSAGKAGDIDIKSPQVTIGEGAKISATALEGASNTETGGNISINTNILNIYSDLGILAETQGESRAGSITLKPYQDNPDLDINFTNNGFISARTTSTGNGGNINITAPETIDITGDGQISVETTGAGNAGKIDIETANLTIADGIDITASTTGAGNAGDINIDTNNFTLETGTTLTTETDSSGSAGDITINSPTVTVGEGAKISATAKENATNTETAGNISINSDEINISGELGIFAETQGEAPAGTLSLKPYNDNPDIDINFTNNGFISARTTSSGNGGNIDITAPENINIQGNGKITVETEGTGNAGEINIQTQNLTIAEGIDISAATSDSGAGGSININPTAKFELNGQIITETTSTGDGGKISINTGSLTAENSTISAKSTETATGNAGEIEITAQENITTGIITSSANNKTEAADGGNISITSEQGEINATQPIQSFSEQGNAGDVSLKARTDVTTNIISSHGQQQGGQINITAETGNINTSNGTLANYSGGGDGGNVNLTAPQGDITTSNIYSFADGNGGQIRINAGGEINLSENSNIISASEPPEEQGSGGAGRGGDIILEAGNNINTTTARIYSGADDGDTGNVELTAESTIETGQIDLASGFVRERLEFNDNNNFTLIPRPEGVATQGFAGDISIKSNNGTIDTTASTINSRSPDGSGDITIEALGNITTGKLEASALNTTKPTTGGDITITSQQGEITATQAIETFSEAGTAGSVNIDGAGHVEVNTILSQGTQRGGDITIHSSSENSINVQDDLNTFSTEGIAGNITLTSPGSITIRGIRSDGMQQGGEIIVESGIGNIDATGEDIDSFSEQGIGGDVQLNASESVNIANVSSYGLTESGDLTIQSQTAQVNTENVTTQSPAGNSGSIIINGTEVGTGDLSSIGTTSAGEINVEAVDGSIQTYDVEIKSDGTIGSLSLQATEDVETGDITQEAGEGDANTDISSGGDQTTGDINQTAEEDTTNNQTSEGDITTGDINQNAGDDATNNQTTGGNITTDDSSN